MGLRTLMRDLEYGPFHLLPLLALVRRILGVFHFVRKFEQRIFDIIEAVGRRLFVAGTTDGRHVACGA